MAGKMRPGIRAWQRALQRFLMTRPATAVFRRILHHADAFLLRLTAGRLTFTRAAGLPVIELTTTGAKSGQLRTLPLAGYPDENSLVLVASNFGSEHHPAWYHNLKAHPQCLVREKGEARPYLAREVTGSEREGYWELVSAYYIGYEAYRRRAVNRQIPIMVLDPRN